MMDFLFFFNSLLLGVGLAMDAFSVSLANGVSEHSMKLRRMCFIAGIYAFFQCIMPLAGWLCVHTVVVAFESFRRFIPWIALVLLLGIGGKMIIDSLRGGEEDRPALRLTPAVLLLQGVATSIDALSVGFTIAGYGFTMALVCSLIIAVVTFVICIAGLELGRRIGTGLSRRAGILGGSILILIGLEIFIKGVIAA